MQTHQSTLQPPSGSAAKPSAEPQVFSLRELAQYLAPRTFRYWARAVDYLSLWPTTAKKDLTELNKALALRRQLSIHEVLDWKPGDPLRLEDGGKTYAEKLDEIYRRGDMERRRNALYKGLVEKIRAVLMSPGCDTKGIGPAGTPVLVAREIIPQLDIDLKRQVLSANGGPWSKWESAFVIWRPEDRPRRTDRKNDQRAILAALKELYGEDIPTGMGSTGPEFEAKI